MSIAAEVEHLRRMRTRGVFKSYIEYIRFPKFRNLAPGTQIDFSFPVTALVGPNGIGKSSVLTALYGAPLNSTPADYWFSTAVDPIGGEPGGARASGAKTADDLLGPRFVYGYKPEPGANVIEVRKARIEKKSRTLDYWETTRPRATDGMAPMPRVSKGEALPHWRVAQRYRPIRMPVLYLNFRRELSSFDKYFFFGRMVTTKTMQTKQDRIRRHSPRLRHLIDSGATSLVLRGAERVTSNRLLAQSELEVVSHILGRKYSEARLVTHSLFGNDAGLSVYFKMPDRKYSEAVAGSGEVAVVSLATQIMQAAEGTLILLDEPEVSLHPGAQTRLMQFLLQQAKEKKHQVVLSTHSPTLVAHLPPEAIKVFDEDTAGKFVAYPSSLPEAAFVRLGVTGPAKIRIVVEDVVAQAVVNRALRLLGGADSKAYEVRIAPGGADTILAHHVPHAMLQEQRTLFLLDGDKAPQIPLQAAATIPPAKDPDLEAIVKRSLGTVPTLLIDGGVRSAANKVDYLRKYIDYAIAHIRYLPRRTPEAIVCESRRDRFPDADENSAKDLFTAHCRELAGGELVVGFTAACAAQMLDDSNADLTLLTELSALVRKFASATLS